MHCWRSVRQPRRRGRTTLPFLFFELRPTGFVPKESWLTSPRRLPLRHGNTFIAGPVVPALTVAAEAGRLASESGQTLFVPATNLAEAVARAQRGQGNAARGLVAETEAILLPLGATPLLAMVALARGRVELATGHYGDAYQRLERLFDRNDVAFHAFLRGHALADLVDAALGSDGDLDLVRRTVNEWRKIAVDTTAPYLAAQVSYADAGLTKDEHAEERFRAAIVSARGCRFSTPALALPMACGSAAANAGPPMPVRPFGKPPRPSPLLDRRAMPNGH